MVGKDTLMWLIVTLAVLGVVILDENWVAGVLLFMLAGVLAIVREVIKPYLVRRG